MKHSYVARQPILDREKKTVAYELLFRNGPKNTFPEIEAEKATHRLVSEQFLNTEHQVVGDKLAYVNFPYQSLISQIPELLPKEKLVVEILEDCEPTNELLKAVIRLRKKGYTIALDDFIPSPAWKKFLPHIQIIKFDIRAIPLAKAAKFIRLLEGTHIEFLAEKVETYEEYQHALDAGFSYFQGYFFSKPEILRQKAIQPSFLTVIQLCKAIAQSEIDYGEVEGILTCDVTLSYQLLRYVNSSYTVSSEIKSFRQALAYLGENRLRKFVSLVALASTDTGKPNSLYELSIQRARHCELITQCAGRAQLTGQAFLTGMFSLLDSLLDQSLETIITAIPIDPEIKNALLEQSGDLGDILSLAIAYDRADWDNVAILSERLNVGEDCLAESYAHSIEWSSDLFSKPD